MQQQVNIERPDNTRIAAWSADSTRRAVDFEGDGERAGLHTSRWRMQTARVLEASPTRNNCRARRGDIDVFGYVDTSVVGLTAGVQKRQRVTDHAEISAERFRNSLRDGVRKQNVSSRNADLHRE